MLHLKMQSVQFLAEQINNGTKLFFDMNSNARKGLIRCIRFNKLNIFLSISLYAKVLILAKLI